MAITLSKHNQFSKFFYCWREVNCTQNPYNVSYHIQSMLPQQIMGVVQYITWVFACYLLPFPTLKEFWKLGHSVFCMIEWIVIGLLDIFRVNRLTYGCILICTSILFTVHLCTVHLCHTALYSVFCNSMYWVAFCSLV